MSNVSKVSVIIPNYNGITYLKKCLSCLYQQTFADFDVFIVDNGSSDHSVSFVRIHYPEITVIQLKRNFGFSYAVNQGLRSSSSPYVLLLNNDAFLHRSALSHLVETMDKDPKVFSVCPKILYHHQPSVIYSAGDMYTLMGFAFSTGQGLPGRRDHRMREVLSSCGAASLYRRSLFQQAGTFDHRFFAYLEDVDLGIRACLQGYKNIYQPRALVRHVGSATTGSRYNPFKVFHSSRNNILLLRKNFSAPALLAASPFLCLGGMAKYFYFRKIHLSSFYVSGLISGLRSPGFPGKSLGTSSSKKRVCGLILKGTFLYFREFCLRRLVKSQ